MVYILFLFVLAVGNLVVSYRKSSVKDRKRIQLVSLGTTFSFAWVAAFTAIIPYFTGDWTLSLFGPSGLTVMVVTVAYTIIKHKLFDIRLVCCSIARIYPTLLGTLVGVYVLADLWLVKHRAGDWAVDRGANSLYRCDTNFWV